MWSKRVEIGVVVILLFASCGRPLSVGNPPRMVTTSADVTMEPGGATPAPRSEESLEALARSEDPIVRKRALARIALARAESGDLDDAARSFAEAAAAYPEIRTWLLSRKIDIEKRLGRFEDAVSTANELIATEPATTATTLARIDLPGLLILAGKREAALAALRFASEVKTSETTEPRLVELARTLAQHGLIGEATALRMRLLTEYPRGRNTEATWNEIASLPRSASPLWTLGVDRLTDLADRLGRANHHSEALQAIALAKKRFPARAGDSSLRWLEATSQFSLRRYEDVVRIRPKAGESRWASLQRLRAHALWRIGRDAEFVRILESLIRQAPAGTESMTARVLLGRYYLTDGDDPSRAARYLEDAIRTSGPGPGGEHLWTLAWIRISAGDAAVALRDLERYLEQNPDADYTSNALFWSAKLHERGGDTDRRDALLRDLITRYPFNYYSYRARQILGFAVIPAAETADGAPFPIARASDEDDRDSRLVVVDELDAIGLEHDATEQLQRIVEESPEPALAMELADRYCRIGRPPNGIRLLTRHFSGVIRRGATGVPHRFWEVLYPLAWWPDVVQLSTIRGIDPYLVAAIIRQESGFDPAAVSGAGAVGLMQIMPREIDRIARAGAFEGSFSREDLFDPATNLRFGTVELSGKLHEMNGELVAALAAYNAGEEPVRRWLREIPRDDEDFFIESIPYAETRLYVKSIIRNRLEYARVYGDETAAMTIGAPRSDAGR